MKKPVKSAGEAARAASVQADIEEVLQAYWTALNASNAERVLTVFTPDGVFMAPNSPSKVGADAIRAAYNGISNRAARNVRMCNAIHHLSCRTRPSFRRTC
jgi:uncharacterized protein (TIGR02246 family)